MMIKSFAALVALLFIIRVLSRNIVTHEQCEHGDIFVHFCLFKLLKRFFSTSDERYDSILVENFVCFFIHGGFWGGGRRVSLGKAKSSKTCITFVYFDSFARMILWFIDSPHDIDEILGGSPHASSFPIERKYISSFPRPISLLPESLNTSTRDKTRVLRNKRKEKIQLWENNVAALERIFVVLFFRDLYAKW